MGSLIRPKYSDIKFTGANQLFVLDDHVDPQWKLITEEEDVISPNEFDDVYPLSGDKYFVKDDGDSWIIIDDKGKKLRRKLIFMSSAIIRETPSLKVST